MKHTKRMGSHFNAGYNMIVVLCCKSHFLFPNSYISFENVFPYSNESFAWSPQPCWISVRNNTNHYSLPNVAFIFLNASWNFLELWDEERWKLAAFSAARAWRFSSLHSWMRMRRRSLSVSLDSKAYRICLNRRIWSTNRAMDLHEKQHVLLRKKI